MKKNFLVTAVLLSALIAQAKNITVAIKGFKPNLPVMTEVTPLGMSDTLEVTPAVNATVIYLSVKDLQQNVHQLCCLPAKSNDILTFDPSALPTGYMLEIADDRGFVFSTFGN